MHNQVDTRFREFIGQLRALAGSRNLCPSLFCINFQDGIKFPEILGQIPPRMHLTHTVYGQRTREREIALSAVLWPAFHLTCELFVGLGEARGMDSGQWTQTDTMTSPSNQVMFISHATISLCERSHLHRAHILSATIQRNQKGNSLPLLFPFKFKHFERLHGCTQQDPFHVSLSPSDSEYIYRSAKKEGKWSGQDTNSPRYVGHVIIASSGRK